MAEINRYYRPAQGRYQSQFVPKKLPVDMMAKMLYGKQQKADQMLAASIKLGDWDQQALGWHDKEYVKGIKNEIQEFAAASMTEDRTSPEFQRRYLELNRRIKNDENLKKISKSVATHNEYMENIKKLRATNEHQADILEADYLYRLNEYTKEGGKGFEGTALGDSNILKGVDEFKEALDFFTPLKESGSESVKFLGEGIAYKKGWTGITDKTVRQQVERQFDLYKETRGAHQMRLRELQKLGLVESQFNALPADKKKQVNSYIDGVLANNFLEVGRTIVHGKSTTNMDTALNAARTEAKEEAEAMIVTGESVAMEETKGEHIMNQINDLKTEEAQIKAILNRDDKKQILTAENRKYYEQQLVAATEAKVELQRQNKANYQYARAQAVEGITPQEKMNFGIIKAQVGDNLKNVDISNPVIALKAIDAEIRRLTMAAASGQSGLPDTGATNQLVAARRLRNAVKPYADKTLNIFEKEFFTKGEGQSLVQVESITAPTGDGSVMTAMNKAVQGNPTGFIFRNDKGEVITGSEMNGEIVSFDGLQYTLGNAANSDNFGVKGTMKYKRPKLNSDGTHYEKNGVPQYEVVTQSVTAIPQGANQQFNRDQIAKEFYETAQQHERLGNIQDRDAALDAARTYTEATTYDELRNFQQDVANKSTIFQVRTPIGQGRSDLANVNVEKIGDVNAGGGYRITFIGTGLPAEEAQSIDDALRIIQERTK